MSCGIRSRPRRGFGSVVTADRLRLEVEDRGVGMAEAGDAAGLGLIAMRERADILQGTLEILRPPEGGTLVVLDVPLTQAALSMSHEGDHCSAGGRSSACAQGLPPNPGRRSGHPGDRRGRNGSRRHPDGREVLAARRRHGHVDARTRWRAGHARDPQEGAVDRDPDSQHVFRGELHPQRLRCGRQGLSAQERHRSGPDRGREDSRRGTALRERALARRRRSLPTDSSSSRSAKSRCCSSSRRAIPTRRSPPCCS